jgi:hypothetical protein
LFLRGLLVMSEFSITPGVCTQESSSCLQLHGLCVATAETLESRFCPKLVSQYAQPLSNLI